MPIKAFLVPDPNASRNLKSSRTRTELIWNLSRIPLLSACPQRILNSSRMRTRAGKVCRYYTSVCIVHIFSSTKEIAERCTHHLNFLSDHSFRCLSRQKPFKEVFKYSKTHQEIEENVSNHSKISEVSDRCAKSKIVCHGHDHP